MAALAMLYLLVMAAPATVDSNIDCPGWCDQCTSFVAEYVHRLTGKWPAFYGDAKDWADSAARGGWTVSAVPRARSVLVLQPGEYRTNDNIKTYIAGHMGHTGWVDSVSGNYIHVVDRNAQSDGQYGERSLRIHPSMRFIYVE